MFEVTPDDLVSLNVLKVVHEDLLREHVDEGLDVSSHDLLVLSLLNQPREVAVGEGRHKKLHVEMIPIKVSEQRLRLCDVCLKGLPEEDGGILDHFFLTHVGPDLVSQVQNGSHN